jgi:hypothetical protein
MTHPVRYAVVHLPSEETALVVSLTESKVGLKAGWYRMIFDDEARSAIDGGPYETAEAALVRAVEPTRERPACPEEAMEEAAHNHVHGICVAYESGFGHGLANDGMVNPYLSASCEREAYRLGREAGLGAHSRVNRRAEHDGT